MSTKLSLSKRRVYYLSSLIVAFAGVFFFLGYPKISIVLIMLMTLAFLVDRLNRNLMKPYDRNRADCLEILRKRGGTDIGKQIDSLSRQSGVCRSELERIWTGVTRFLKIEPDLVRTHDRLKSELRGVIAHPDYDVFFCPLVVLHKGAARESLERVKTWGELILCFYQFEQEVGKLGTKVLERDGRVQYLWDA